MEFIIKADNTKETIAEKDKLVEKAMVECGLIMERYAIEKCHVKTGRLRNSITFATEKFHSKGNGQSGVKASTADMETHSSPEKGSVYIGTNVEYAPYVELGSSRRNPAAFLKPSIQNHLDEYKNVIEKTLGD